MHSKEWPLIVFTILAQTAVGAFLVLEAVGILAVQQNYAEEMIDALINPALLFLIPLLAVGGLIAAFHLGRPLRILRVISNLQHSWLSREMLLGALFGLMVSVYTVMRLFEIGSVAVHSAIALCAAISGIGLVYSMSRLYRLRTIPAWDTAATPATFFTTAFLLGTLAVGLVISGAYTRRTLVDDVLCWLALAAVVLLGLQLAVIALNTAYLSSRGGVSAESAGAMFASYRTVFFLRLILAVVGTGLFSIFACQTTSFSGQETGVRSILYIAFALVLAAEILGRFLFYASYKREGI